MEEASFFREGVKEIINGFSLIGFGEFKAEPPQIINNLSSSYLIQVLRIFFILSSSGRGFQHCHELHGFDITLKSPIATALLPTFSKPDLGEKLRYGEICGYAGDFSFNFRNFNVKGISVPHL